MTDPIRPITPDPSQLEGQRAMTYDRQEDGSYTQTTTTTVDISPALAAVQSQIDEKKNQYVYNEGLIENFTKINIGLEEDIANLELAMEDLKELHPIDPDED